LEPEESLKLLQRRWIWQLPAGNPRCSDTSARISLGFKEDKVSSVLVVEEAPTRMATAKNLYRISEDGLRASSD